MEQFSITQHAILKTCNISETHLLHRNYFCTTKILIVRYKNSFLLFQETKKNDALAALEVHWLSAEQMA